MEVEDGCHHQQFGFSLWIFKSFEWDNIHGKFNGLMGSDWDFHATFMVCSWESGRMKVRPK